jgi:hypothetical protein
MSTPRSLSVTSCFVRSTDDSPTSHRSCRCTGTLPNGFNHSLVTLCDVVGSQRLDQAPVTADDASLRITGMLTASNAQVMWCAQDSLHQYLTPVFPVARHALLSQGRPINVVQLFHGRLNETPETASHFLIYTHPALRF